MLAGVLAIVLLVPAQDPAPDSPAGQAAQLPPTPSVGSGPVSPDPGDEPVAVAELTAEERERLVRELLRRMERETGSINLDIPSIDVIEREVETLRATADSLAGAGAAAARIRVVAPDPGPELESLGVTAERATEIRELDAEVQGLRARLAVRQLRSDQGPPAPEPVGEPSVPPPGTDVPPGAAAGPPAAADAGAASLVQAMRHPTRAVLLLYRAGELDRLIVEVENIGTAKVEEDARYAYACALSARGRLDDARAVFAELSAVDGRRTLAAAASRHVERIDQLRLGAVRAAPLLGERSRP